MKERLLAFHKSFETVLVSVLLVLLMLILLLATVEFVYLLFHGIWERLQEIDSIEFMRGRMHVVFAGFLVLLLGIELMETVRMYLTEHVIHVEIVFLVAMIAVGRHVVEFDYAHGEGTTLFGIAALILALAAGYYLLKKAGPPSGSRAHRDAD